MTQTPPRPAAHRIDLPCEQAGFTTPPCDVHLKGLPTDAGWTLLAHTAAGNADPLARWLRAQPGIGEVRAAPGIAPKLLRAQAAAPPPAWALVASFAKVHHLHLAPDGHATWFIEALPGRVVALAQRLQAALEPPLGPNEVRCRPIHADGRAPISKRQFETLSAAVALGYYEIPHSIDLRTLATRTGISLGAVSELLRRAEGAVLTHFVDARLMGLPALAEAPAATPSRPLDNLLWP